MAVSGFASFLNIVFSVSKKSNIWVCLDKKNYAGGELIQELIYNIGLGENFGHSYLVTKDKTEMECLYGSRGLTDLKDQSIFSGRMNRNYLTWRKDMD